MRWTAAWRRPLLEGEGARRSRLRPLSAKYSTKPQRSTNPSQQQSQRNASESSREITEVPSEWAAQARHYLRAILRECTYLPDPQARRYISQYALSRFRKSDFKFKNPDNNEEQDLEAEKRRLHKDAQKQLNKLVRANNGDRRPLLKVLLAAYGREGKRRRELMQLWMPIAGKQKIDTILSEAANRAEVPEKDALGPLEACGTEASNRRSEDSQILPRLSPAMDALVKSQAQAAPPYLTRPNPKKLSPNVPVLNAKLKPMPKSRVRNLTKKWYADILDRVLPPLPTEEWHRLRYLASGKTLLGPLPQLRSRESSIRAGYGAHSSALETVVAKGIRKLDKESWVQVSHREKITPRFMQRLYAQVFGQCPLMDWDDSKNRWNITWGHYALHKTQQPEHSFAAKHLPFKSSSDSTAETEQSTPG
ncbi:Hypothetical predicted protein [Lecanosticta acicola]|uniref:LYR motif-containing protein Cup1-like N-terminal domain-containing protein n=1 Tax=Lecanosticta acicola TaxID=111012 RepID=A0AAI9EEY4_9PEZI|nr:Hypothetical predicted protein [Lecanosticta acicola]